MANVRLKLVDPDSFQIADDGDLALFINDTLEVTYHKTSIPEDVRIIESMVSHAFEAGRRAEGNYNERYKLHTANYGGNLHETAIAINKLGWAEYIVVMQNSGFSTQVVFRMPDEMVNEIRTKDSSYVSDPHHDDYNGEE